MLNDGGSVRGDEELDGLGHSIVGEESPRLGVDELAGGSGDGDEERGRGGADFGDLGVGGGELDVDEIDLELLLGLDSDKNGGSTAGDDDLVGEVDRLEDEGEGSLLRKWSESGSASALPFDVRLEAQTHKLHDDALDEGSEGDLLVLLRVVEVLGEDGSDLRIGVGLEDVAALLEDETELLVCESRRRQ